MRCHIAKGLLSPYIDLVLPEEQRIGLERHLSSCDPCRRELADLQRMVTRLKEMEKVEAPADFMEELRNRLAHEKTVPFNRKNRFNLISTRTGWFAATAASVALVAGIYISSMIPYPMVASFFDKGLQNAAPRESGLSNSIERFLQEKEQEMRAALNINENREQPSNDPVTKPGNTTSKPQQVAEAPVNEPVTPIEQSNETRIINTVSMQMKASDIEGAAQDVTQLASLYDGSAETSSSQLMSGVSKVVVVRVSPENVSSFVAGVKSLGCQTQPMHGTQNVSDTYNQYQNRLDEVQEEIDRLESMAELSADEENKLKAMRFEKTYLENQIKDLDQKTGLVAVNVTISGELDQ